MSDYQVFCGQIADWINRQDFSQSLLDFIVSMGEQHINSLLRIDHMMTTVTALIVSRCAQVPDDWLEMDLVMIQNPNGANGYLPIRYKSNDEFFNLTDSWSYGYYTINGRQIFFGGSPDAINGINFQMTYYQEVPVFSQTGTSWLYTKYPALYLYAALMHADLHAVGEEQNAANMKGLVEDLINKLNAEHLRSKSSGSRITRSRIRSFG